MGEAPRQGALMDGLPRAIQAIAFLSFTLSVAFVLLVHHYLTTYQCPIPQ